MSAIGVVGIEARKLHRIAAGSDLKRQLSGVVSQPQIVRADARTEDEHIRSGKRGFVVYHIHAIAQVEEIGIVSGSAGERIAACLGAEDIVDVRAGEAIGTGGAVDLKPEAHEVRKAQGCPVAEAEGFDRVRTQGVLRIEALEAQGIARAVIGKHHAGGVERQA